MKSKTQEERLQEVLVIFQKLKSLGICDDVCSGLVEFRAAANRFVRDGGCATGRIQLPEISRCMVYRLRALAHVESTVQLVQMEA
jgi:hypothetical protein